jgi:DNA-binding MarR family transcriptional regulator
MNHPETALLTKIILTVFRVNGLLLEAGDALVKPLRLTSARWQVIGAIALAGAPLTVPQIAAAMGITRQGVQKQVNMLVSEGLLVQRLNPGHKRSAFYALTSRGARVYANVDSLQTRWAGNLAKGLSRDKLQATVSTLETILQRLKPGARGGRK